MGLKTLLSHFLVNSISEKKVLSGPFQNMAYISRSTGSAYPPKILGTYEKELHPVINKITNSAPSLIIDIGAAEGYYAVGCSVLLPSCQVIAFEANPKGRQMIKEMAILNGVKDRVEISGECDIDTLNNYLLNIIDGCWIIIDIEGGEKTLLDPDKIEALKKCSILVEIHDHIVPDTGALIKEKFKNTHQIEQIEQSERTELDFPIQIKGLTRLWPKAIIDKSMDEKRKEHMYWLILTPLS